MPDNDSGAAPSKGGGLWARLFGFNQEELGDQKEQTAEDSAESEVGAESPPLAEPIKAAPEPAVPLAQPIPAIPLAGSIVAAVAVAPAMVSPVLAPPVVAPPVAPPVEEIAPELCPACQTPRKANQPFCEDCGWMF